MKTWSIENLSLAAIALLLPLLGALAALAWQQGQRGPLPHYAHLPLLLAAVGAALLSKVGILRMLRRRAGRRLAHSEKRYRQIVETALEGIWLADADGRISYANVRSAEMVGYPPAELLGRHINDFIDAPPDQIHCDIYEHPEQDLRVLRDLRYRTRDGLPGWALVRSQTLRDDDGQFTGALVMASDITARKLGEQALAQAHAELELRIAARTAELETAVAQLRAEMAVRQAAEQARANSDSRLHEIISMMPLSLFIKDGDSRIVLMNEACENSWGVRFDSVFGQRSSADLPPDKLAEFQANDRAAFERRQLVVSEESVWNVQRQETRHMRTFKKPVFDADGQPQMLICMSVDISESKQAEAALQQSLRQLRALSDHHHAIKAEERRRIALDIHDELGQNLMALKIDVSMLHARTAAAHPRLHARTAGVLATLDATIRSARGIINELHPTALALGLHAAIEWLMQQIERRGGLRCRLDVIDASADVLLCAHQTAAIFRVVQEALSNVRVYAGATALDVSLNLHPQRLTIVVNDDGPGPADAELLRAMALSHNAIKERVAAMGGEMVRACRQGGSTLSILLPGVAALIEQDLRRDA
jgi:two-component system sensor histidine kinase UhpB